MVTSDPPPESLDAGWEDPDADEEGRTRIVDSGEVLARALSSAKATGTSGGHELVVEKSEIRPAADLRATLPPPMPVSDYVEQMMRDAPESEGAYRPSLETLHEIDPLQFDASAPPPALDEPGADSGPHGIPTPVPLGIDIDAPFDLEPVGVPAQAVRSGAFLAPQAPLDLLSASFEDLDELPVDEVLESVSRRPAELASRPTPAVPISALRPSSFAKDATRSAIPPPPTPVPDRVSDPPTGAGLRLGGLKIDPPKPTPPRRSTTPPATRPASSLDFDPEVPQGRPTNPGIPTRELLAAAAQQDLDFFDARPPAHTPSGELTETADHVPDGLDLALATGEPVDVTHLSSADLGLEPLEPEEPDPAFEEVQSLFDIGSYNTALDMAESILRDNPAHAKAKACVQACQEHLLQTYLNRLGDRTWILRVAIGPAEMISLGLDHRTGFLLSFIDGAMSIDEVLDVASMPPFDAARMLCELKSRGVIVAEPPSPSSRS